MSKKYVIYRADGNSKYYIHYSYYDQNNKKIVELFISNTSEEMRKKSQELMKQGYVLVKGLYQL